MPNHLLIEVMSITLCIVCASFINTYIFSKAKKNILLMSYMAVASSLLLWAIVRLLRIVSPTLEITKMYIIIEHILALLFSLFLSWFLMTVYFKRVASKKSTILFIAVTSFIAIIAVFICFSYPTLPRTTYILIFSFLVIHFIMFFYRYKLFPEIEISLDSIAENIKDSVAVFDSKGIVVDMNLLAIPEIFISKEEKTLVSFIEHINDFSANSKIDIKKVETIQDECYEAEICILSCAHSTSRTMYYIFNASSIKDKKGEKAGTLCTLRDITENKLISMELDHKNSELQELNKELGNFIKIADRLAEEKERAQIAREINSTIGQKLTEILSVLEVIKLTNKEETDVFEEPLNEAILRCREILSEIRMVVSKLIPNKGSSKNRVKSD